MNKHEKDIQMILEGYFPLELVEERILQTLLNFLRHLKKTYPIKRKHFEESSGLRMNKYDYDREARLINYRLTKLREKKE